MLVSHTALEGNDFIREFLKSSTPFMAGKIGNSEFCCILSFLQTRTWEPPLKNLMYLNAGFFPADDKSLEKFCELYLKQLGLLDLIAVWLEETLLINSFQKNIFISQLRGIEPYYFSDPWSSSLAGKRVLVIHPYEESIQSQYKKRKPLFDDSRVLPDFDLDTIKAVQSIAGSKTPFQNWFQAYEYMCDEIIKKNFDIAIIGAGAYGLPLAGFVKTIGKQAIHIGGAVQILFGIKGKRWDFHEDISKLYKEGWVRPAPSETPENHGIIEGGCYW